MSPHASPVSVSALRRPDADPYGFAQLLTDDVRRQAMRNDAYSNSRSMTWERTAKRYLAAFETARRGRMLSVIAGDGEPRPVPAMTAPSTSTTSNMAVPHLVIAL